MIGLVLELCWTFLLDIKSDFYLILYFCFNNSSFLLLTERSSIAKGHKAGELVIPLARYFNDTATDIESGSTSVVSDLPLFIYLCSLMKLSHIASML